MNRRTPASVDDNCALSYGFIEVPIGMPVFVFWTRRKRRRVLVVLSSSLGLVAIGFCVYFEWLRGVCVCVFENEERILGEG